MPSIETLYHCKALKPRQTPDTSSPVAFITLTMGMENLIEQLDPEIARQMGFTSFGGAKRRKLATADDAVTDAEESKQDQDEPPASGANAEIIRGGYNDPSLPPGLGIYGTRDAPSKLIFRSKIHCCCKANILQVSGKPKKRKRSASSRLCGKA